MKSRTSTPSRHGPSTKPPHAGTWPSSVAELRTLSRVSETLVIRTSLVPGARVSRRRPGSRRPVLGRPRVAGPGGCPTGSFATSRLGPRDRSWDALRPLGDLGPEPGAACENRGTPRFSRCRARRASILVTPFTRDLRLRAARAGERARPGACRTPSHSTRTADPCETSPMKRTMGVEEEFLLVGQDGRPVAKAAEALEA